jgi:hypothetical protein
MFCAPGAGQRQHDVIRILFTAIVPQRGETTRVTLARDKSADDALSGDACDIAERLGQLDMHLSQGLLPVEDMWGAMFEELGAMAQQRPQRHEIRLRTKRADSNP